MCTCISLLISYTSPNTLWIAIEYPMGIIGASLSKSPIDRNNGPRGEECLWVSEWVSLWIIHATFVPHWFPQTCIHTHSIDTSCTCVPGGDIHCIVPCTRQVHYFVRRLPGNNDKEKRTAERRLYFFRHIFIEVYLPCRVSGVLRSWLPRVHACGIIINICVDFSMLVTISVLWVSE